MYCLWVSAVGCSFRQCCEFDMFHVCSAVQCVVCICVCIVCLVLEMGLGVCGVFWDPCMC